MKNFVSLPDGTLLNVNAIAHIEPTEGDPPSFGVYLLALADNRCTPLCLAGELAGDEAKAFLDALSGAGIDVTDLRKHMGIPIVGARTVPIGGV